MWFMCRGLSFRSYCRRVNPAKVSTGLELFQTGFFYFFTGYSIEISVFFSLQDSMLFYSGSCTVSGGWAFDFPAVVFFLRKISPGFFCFFSFCFSVFFCRRHFPAPDKKIFLCRTFARRKIQGKKAFFSQVSENSFYYTVCFRQYFSGSQGNETPGSGCTDSALYHFPYF